MNKLKIFNDPVHGFIQIPDGILLQIIDHPFFQRLRRICQVGLSSYVYPGAVHTRYSHALGSMHLTMKAIKILRDKGIEITDKEEEATLLAILLHDIGHGPLSHALEFCWLDNYNHEKIGDLILQFMNIQFEDRLSLSIEIFEGKYRKFFLHQLVSSQLDMDRMDYLMRDSFFTGVIEGIVATDRIINTLNVVDNRLVVEQKGVYSVEKFIIARRLMYWQVYLHKASVAAEFMLLKIINRAKELFKKGKYIWLDPSLEFFFSKNINSNREINKLSKEIITHFTNLDDSTIYYALKMWSNSSDFILSDLSRRILERKLFKVKFQNEPISDVKIESLKSEIINSHLFDLISLDLEDVLPYYISTGEVSNSAYLSPSNQPIEIYMKDGQLLEISKISEFFSINEIVKPVVKYFVCSPMI